MGIKKTKGIISYILMMTIVLLMTGNVFAAAEQASNPIEVPDVKIIMDGKLEKFANVPISVNNSTLLPLRELLIKLGVPNDDEHIIYNHEEKSVTVWDGQTKIYLLIGQKDAFVNDESILLNAAPILYGNSTYIPLRFVAETMGKKVVWDGRTRAALICDEAKYDSIKQILNKSDEKMAKVKKLKQDIDLTVNTASGDPGVDVAVNATTALDITGQKMQMDFLMKIAGIQVSTAAYYADNASYTLNPLTGVWDKRTYTDAEYKSLLKGKADNNAINNNDILCTGLNQIDSEYDDEILLKGDVFLMDMFEKAIEQQDFGYNEYLNDDVKFDGFSVEISLNRTTYLINYIAVNMKMLSYEAEIEDEMTGNISVRIAYSSYDGDFVIIVPEDVIKDAVLAK